MSRSRILSLAPALAALTFALTASAGLELKGKPKPSVNFTAIGPGGLKIDGSGDELSLKEEGDKLIFKASVKKLKTGIGLRDNHLRKYIEADKWPDASFVVDKSKVKMPGKGKAKGKFRLHGVTKELDVDYSVDSKDGGYSVTGTTEINLDHFKIEQPCYLGVCVDKDVKVSVSFHVKK